MAKRKKALVLAITAVVSGTMLVTTAYAAAVNVSGYEKLKTAAFNVLQMDNYTLKASLAVQYDGTEIASADVTSKLQDKNNSSSVYSSTSADGFASDSEEYLTDEYRAYGSNGSYRIYENNKYGSGIYRNSGIAILPNTELTDNQKRLMSLGLDMFAGDVKNYFTNDNGSIGLRLERNQIPEFFQAFMSVLSEQLTKNPYMTNGEENMDDMIMNIANDMSIHSVYVNSFVDEFDRINKAEFTGTLSGRDNSGQTHYMTMTINCYVSDIGTTVADKIDLNNVNITQPNEFKYNFDELSESLIYPNGNEAEFEVEFLQ